MMKHLPRCIARFIRTALTVTLLFLPLTAKEYSVSTAAQISALAGSLAAGDTVTMTNGTWTNQAVVFKGTGTADKPILLRAQTNQSVLLNGTSTLRIAGKYLVVDGLRFEGGYSASGGVVEFQGTDGSASSYCRLTRTTIKSYNPASVATDYKWVSLFGTNNRVDHCHFENKVHMGTTLVVWLNSTNTPRYHRIDHNYFGPRPVLVDVNGDPVNGGECIRIGTSDYSMNDANCTVEENYFEKCNGEIEAISNKSCGNIYRYNVFVSCEGMLTLRHGNRCSVYGNYFFCNNAANSGGIRIIGEDHKVYNNYIENNAGSSMKTGITIVNGVLNSPLNRYFQVKRALVVFNTLVGNRYSFNIGAGKDSELTLPPLDCVIANNLVWSTKEQLISYTDTPINMTYAGNIFYGSSLGITKPAGITVTDPKLFRAPDSLWRVKSGGPEIDAASGTYDFVTEDIDGQTRTVPFDVGVDELSSDAVVRRPVTKSDVGPSAIVLGVQRHDRNSVPHTALMLRSYPNPFNPSTTLSFSSPAAGTGTVIVFDVSGKAVGQPFSGPLRAGEERTVSFDASHLAAGIYFAELRIGGRSAVTRLLFLK